MSITIADVKTEIQITHTTLDCFLNKADLSLDTSGDLVIFYYQNNPASPLFAYDTQERSWIWEVDYRNVTTPASVSAIDLMGQINEWLYASGGYASEKTIWRETPEGVIDGANREFTAANDIDGNVEVLYAPEGGALQVLTPVTDYAQASGVITLEFTPASGSKIYFNYNKV